MPPSAPGGAAEPGVSEFDSFIHADLCAGVSGGADVGAGQFGFLPPFALGSSMPLTKPSAGASELPSLALEWGAGAPADGASGAGSSAASSGSSTAPYAFSQAPAGVWAPGAASTEKLAPPPALAGLATKPDPDAPPLALLLKDEAATPPPGASSSSLYAHDDKRRKLAHSVPAPGEPRPRAATMPEMSKAASSDGADAPRPRRPPGGARRPPPSASQMTEAGQPFPVIDTSAKHSSLFIPPDTSGLTKREARLVKNRAAAFLSRQRKREQFEELGGKCRNLARLAWLLWDALAGAARYVPGGAGAAATSATDRVLHATPLGAQLPRESEDVRAVFQQLVAQQGAIVLESALDEPPAKSAPAGDDELRAQLARARAEAAQARRDADDARRECARLRAAGAAAAAAPGAAAGAAAPAGPPSDAVGLFALVGLALVRWRTTGAVPHELLHELQGAAPAPLNELLGGEDAGRGAVQLRVCRREADAVLCTLATEPDAERAASATPDPAAPADGSSDTSLPSLSSASPTLSSLSTSSTPARRTRRVLALCPGAQSRAEPVAHVGAPLLRDRRAWTLDAWAAEHVAPLVAHRKPALPPAARDTLAEPLRGAELHTGFVLAASLEEESAPPGAPAVRLALYARASAAAPAAPPPRAALARVADALQDAVRALCADADAGEPGGDLLPPADAPKPAEERAPGVFQVTFRP